MAKNIFLAEVKICWKPEVLLSSFDSNVLDYIIAFLDGL